MGYNLHAAIAEPREAVAASSSISKRLSKKKKIKKIYAVARLPRETAPRF